MKELVIVGTSSTAKTIYKFVIKNKLFKVIGFAVNREFLNSDTFCNLPVFELERLDDIINKEKVLLFIAVQWNKLNADRRNIFEKLKIEGYHFANLISPNAIINGDIVGENCWIADFAMVDFGSEISDNVFVKVGAMIGPNCKIQQHSFIGAKSTIGGACIIGEQSFVGLNALIFDNVIIGQKCIIGAGTLLKRNLDNFTLLKTDLNSCIVKNYSEEVIESKLMFRKNVR